MAAFELIPRGKGLDHDLEYRGQTGGVFKIIRLLFTFNKIKLYLIHVFRVGVCKCLVKAYQVSVKHKGQEGHFLAYSPTLYNLT